MMLYLVRHGQSVGNEKMLFFGRTDYPLTDLGRTQARQTADKLQTLSFSRCVASDLSRAWETAQICLAGRSITPEADPRLREQDMGQLENLNWDEADALCGGKMQEMIDDWLGCTPPGGESCTQMEARIAACVEEIVTRGEDTLIVAHNGTLSLLFHHFHLVGDPNRQGWNFTHGTYSAIEIADGNARLAAFNA